MERGLVLSLGNVESRGAKWLLHSPPPRPPPASGLAQEWTVFLCFNVSDFSVKWRQRLFDELHGRRGRPLLSDLASTALDLSIGK